MLFLDSRLWSQSFPQSSGLGQDVFWALKLTDTNVRFRFPRVKFDIWLSTFFLPESLCSLLPQCWKMALPSLSSLFKSQSLVFCSLFDVHSCVCVCVGDGGGESHVQWAAGSKTWAPAKRKPQQATGWGADQCHEGAGNSLKTHSNRLCMCLWMLAKNPNVSAKRENASHPEIILHSHGQSDPNALRHSVIFPLEVLLPGAGSSCLVWFQFQFQFQMNLSRWCLLSNPFHFVHREQHKSKCYSRNTD